MVKAAIACNGGERTPADFDNTMPTLATTAGATAILEVRASNERHSPILVPRLAWCCASSKPPL